MGNVQPKPYQWLAWSATILLVLNAVLAGLNIYPYYVYGFIIANSIWILIGFLWKERSLVFMNAALTVIYIFGIAAKLFHL